MDGIDWNRTRWSYFARIYLKLTNIFAIFISNKVIVDNLIVKKYYTKKFNANLFYIPYGSNILKITSDNIIKKRQLKKNSYILFVGRFSKEKGVHYVIDAFEKINTKFKLVLVGDFYTVKMLMN